MALAGAAPDPARIALILDSDSPVADRGVASRLRDVAVGGLEGPQRPPSFQLTSQGLSSIPPGAVRALEAVPLASEAPVYAGVSLSIGEAFDILRKNEAVRDTVIRRTCGARGNCGAAVHAAATALLDDADAAATRKVRALLDVGRTAHARTIVVITAGWPCRDVNRLGADTVIRELRSSGVTIAVWRLPSLVPFGRGVQDAAEALASRVGGTLMAIGDERDAARARATIVQPVEASSTPPSPPPERISESPDAPAAGTVGADVYLDSGLQRAAAYVERFEKTFSAVIWHERYHQEDRILRAFKSSGGKFDTLAGRRDLDSELLLLWLPNDAAWIAVRDVIAVDGVPRSAADRHVKAALNDAALSIGKLRVLAADNGRFNIGQIVRTFNEPTLALTFLDAHYRQRFSFARGEGETIDGHPTIVYTFTERTRPTIIQDRTYDVPARGAFWIDDATGEVRQTTLELADTAGRLRGTMKVRYAPHEAFDVLVPVEMQERYSSAGSGERVTAVATYSDFRRFETRGRLVIP